MAIALKNCAMCRGKLELASIEKVSGESGPLKMTVYGMPAGKCAKGHAAPVHQDFLLWLLQEARGRLGAVLPAAEAKGMLFKTYLCSCGKELPAKPENTQTFPSELAYEGAPAFKVEFEVPVYKCGCGKAQLRSLEELRKGFANAMVDICDRAGFPHSG